MIDFSRPNWKPLEATLGPLSCRHYMYMGTKIESDGTRINLYKHSDTRRYLNVDDHGNCYQYAGDGYRKITKEKAIKIANS